MQLTKNNLPLVVIVGPTAVGKTKLSIELAKRLGGEIVSADSRLFYRGMDIGTAKPSVEEQSGIKHYLIDVAEPDEIWSLATYQKAANQTIELIHNSGKLPMLVGGTGQYIQAVVYGWTLPPQTPNPRMREILEEWGKEIGAKSLHEKLAILDEDAAANIQYQNLRRTVRALEVIFTSGKKFSIQRKKNSSPYNAIMIGLKRPRKELYERIDLRIGDMIQNGLIEETERLLAKGYSSNLSTLSAIGYREMIAYRQGAIPLDQAILLMKRMTRQFVRRQSNWFNENDPDIHWFEMEDGVLEKIEALIKTKYKLD